MADNLANEWGTKLCLERSMDRSRGRGSGANDSKKSASDELKSLMRTASLDKYKLEKLQCCGSDANLWAVMDITQGNPILCMFACGSYVASDGGPIQSWSTSDFSYHAPLTWIMSPKKSSDFAQKTGIALPYHLPCCNCCDGDIDQWNNLENECLDEIHYRCLESRLGGYPLKAMFMELVLAGSGGLLSPRFLRYLGILGKHHGFYVVVDEIMTAGRCNDISFLLTQTTPIEFQDIVSHITLGKWTGVGIVLKKCNILENQYAQLASRGDLQQIDTTNAVICVKTILAIMKTKKTEQRRSYVLEKIRVDPSTSWGLGLLIFCEKRRSDLAAGLKSRFLPMMEDTPIDKIPMYNNDTGGTNKLSCCAKITVGVKEWLTFSKRRSMGLERRICKALVDIDIFRKNCFLPTILKKYLKEEENMEPCTYMHISSIVETAESQGLLTHMFMGVKRLNQVRTGDLCHRPVNWKDPLEGEE